MWLLSCWLRILKQLLRATLVTSLLNFPTAASYIPLKVNIPNHMYFGVPDRRGSSLIIPGMRGFDLRPFCVTLAGGNTLQVSKGDQRSTTVPRLERSFKSMLGPSSADV
ncbi:hypothetical protein B0H11DRAFT_2081592 [Mycena galericulata]|nr:hypothetical protein B0H11DRAFT_2081592 [Mycena galericulata]